MFRNVMALNKSRLLKGSLVLGASFAARQLSRTPFFMSQWQQVTGKELKLNQDKPIDKTKTEQYEPLYPPVGTPSRR